MSGAARCWFLQRKGVMRSQLLHTRSAACLLVGSRNHICSEKLMLNLLHSLNAPWLFSASYRSKTSTCFVLDKLIWAYSLGSICFWFIDSTLLVF